MSPARLALALTLAFPLSGCVVIGSLHRADALLEEASDHVPGAALEVETENGAITVVAGGGPEVSIQGAFECTGATGDEARERALGAALETRRAADGTLHVSGACGGGRRTNDGLSLEIRLPDVRDLRLSTSNGAITTEGTDGLLVARTSNGRITVFDHLGDVDLVTSNGAIEGEAIAGTVRAESSNGGVDLRLADEAPGPVEARTSNGSIRLAVGGAFRGRVTFDTSAGSVDVDDRAGRVTRRALTDTDGWAEVGTGGSASALATSNGDVELVVLR